SWREDLLTQVDEIGFVERLIELAILVGVDPDGHGQAQDHAIAGPHVMLGDLAEVLELRRVQIRAQLSGRAREPPTSGQLQREVAAVLTRRPAAEPASAGR